MSYRRYAKFTANGKVRTVPTVKIPEKSSDYFVEYRKGEERLDMLSFQYYNDPNYDWLILMANPEYGSMEFNIPKGAILRIPYPLKATIEQYEALVQQHDLLYGNN